MLSIRCVLREKLCVRYVPSFWLLRQPFSANQFGVKN